MYWLGFLHAFLSSSTPLQLSALLVPIWRNADSCGSCLRPPDAKPELKNRTPQHTVAMSISALRFDTHSITARATRLRLLHAHLVNQKLPGTGPGGEGLPSVSREVVSCQGYRTPSRGVTRLGLHNLTLKHRHQRIRQRSYIIWAPAK